MTAVCRFATDADWPQLRTFYADAYREGHPLRNRDFWRWQFGDANLGQAAVVVDRGAVVGHLGAALAGGHSWIITAYLMPDYRGQGWLRELYGLTETLAPNASTNINRAMLDIYRRMGWTRYANLQRFTAVREGIASADAVSPAEIVGGPRPDGHHYWRQPGIVGTTLADGSTAVIQALVGALRVIHIADPSRVLDACWDAGARWVDFMTSWNDPLCRDLDHRHGWTLGDEVPWRVDPLLPGSASDIAVTAHQSLPRDLIIDRTFSDHGRVGSLPETPAT